MTSLLESSDESAKFTMTGESGNGKTGMLASAICAGYKIRVIDTDKGSRLLRSLLTDEEHYPYAKWIKNHNIDLNTAFDYIPINIEMITRTVIQKNPRGDVVSKEILYAPKDANAWVQLTELLENWPNYGNVGTWGPDVILVGDTLSTISEACYFYMQQLNNRLGVREDGYSHQQDTGAAQRQLARFLSKLGSSNVKCNVILNCHIIWIDRTKNFNQSAGQVVRDNKTPELKGYPKAVGQALSTEINSRFNDGFTIHKRDVGTETKRFIRTTPYEGISSKASVYLEPEYPLSSGLAEIMDALLYKPKNQDLIQALRGNNEKKLISSPKHPV
jgi:hypothetical protein